VIHEFTATDARHGPGRPRSGSLAERRKRLLDTARRLVLERGLRAVPLAEIAQEAGVALRTFYLRYGSKQGLLRALIDEEAERHRSELAALELGAKAWHEQLACLAHHVARRTSRRELMRLCDIVMETGEPDLIAALNLAGPSMAKVAVAQALVLAGESDDLCDHFLACMVGGRLQVGPSQVDAPERARRGLDLFLRALPSRS
jgi:AcrR family transcriptional regulator